VVVIPNGVAPIEFPSKARARRRLGLREDELVVGFIGRLVDPRAPDVLIKALALSRPSGPRYRLAMVGTGPLEGSLRALAEDLGVSDRVHWAGELDAKEVLPAFDLFALPSRKEGLPYVVLEALAARLPVVATSAAAVELLVAPGENGLVVPPDRPPLFADALSDLLSDPLRLERLGHGSLARSSRFSAERMVDRTLAEYEACLRASFETRFLPRKRVSEPVDHAAVTRSADESPAFRRDLRLPTVLSAIHDGLPPTRDNPSLTTRTSSVATKACRGGTMASKPRSAELHPGPGFRVKLDFTRLEPSFMERFREFATPDISDLLNRLYAVDPVIRCLTGDHHQLCGPACTVKVFPGDNLMVHKALDVAKPGDVVVVDAGGSTSNAVLGDLISAKARHRRIAGFVVDGLVRDLPSIVPLDFPVFARGTSPIGPLHRGPGEINYPNCCGGVVVNPGDLVVADAAGVIIVPREIAPELLHRLELHKETNQAYFESVRRGDFSNQWVDRLLEEQRCPMIGAAGESRARNGCLPPNGLAAALAGGNNGTLTSAQEVV
jgi:RraA family protein